MMFESRKIKQEKVFDDNFQSTKNTLVGKGLKDSGPAGEEVNIFPSSGK